MKIAYGGDVSEGSTSLHRFNALRRLGHDVVATRIHLATRPRTLVNAVRRRLPFNPEIAIVNQALKTDVETQRPDLVWIDKGVNIEPETIRYIRNFAGAVLHYNPDDPFGLNRKNWGRFTRGLKEYDIHVITRDQNFEEYRRAGAKYVTRFMWGYEPTVHHPYPLTDELRVKFGAPVGFIGTYERQRSETLLAIAASGIPVRVWGNDWDRFKKTHSNLRIEHSGPTDEAYAQAICSIDINLGFLRKNNRDQSTQRSVEIPACGSMLLGERTVEHRSLFDEGREAEFFETDQECVQKLRYYLDHPAERKQLADSGRMRCLNSGYSNDERLKKVLDEVANHLKK